MIVKAAIVLSCVTIIGVFALMFIFPRSESSAATAEGPEQIRRVEQNSAAFCPKSLIRLEDKAFDEKALAKWVRPVIPVVLGPTNEIVATAEIRGVALILSRDEILVSSGPFIVAPSLISVAERMGERSELLHLGALLVWDVLPGGETGTLNAEIIPYVPEDSLGNASSPLILARAQAHSADFPAPDQFPYKLIDRELCPFESLIAVGHWKTPKPELLMTFNEAKVRSVSGSTVLLDGSLTTHDWGAVVFGMRGDGTLGLVGVVREISLRKQRENEVLMVEIGKIRGLEPQSFKENSL